MSVKYNPRKYVMHNVRFGLYQNGSKRAHHSTQPCNCLMERAFELAFGGAAMSHLSVSPHEFDYLDMHLIRLERTPVGSLKAGHQTARCLVSTL